MEMKMLDDILASLLSIGKWAGKFKTVDETGTATDVEMEIEKA